MKYHRVKAFGRILPILLLLSVTCRIADIEAQKLTELMELGLEELMSMEITSVSKKPEKFSNAAAAIFVITQEDIRRSGVTSIPEALRMVPGLQVAHIDANKWAVTSRGFNSRLANKLLVMIDGRSVYTLFFSGVFWEVQNMLLEDIERIEVIRGPGATLWGANAVNGVINIITAQAKNTQEVLVTTGTGTEERGFGGIRYGSKLGENAHYRIYAKYFDRDSRVDALGKDGADSWNLLQGGFRIDWQASARSFLTLQGDIQEGKDGQTITLPSLSAPYTSTFAEDVDVSGENALLRWTYSISDSSETVLQLYYDGFYHDETIMEGYECVYDIELQHRFSLVEWQEIVWGLGYRLLDFDYHSTFHASIDTDSRKDHLFSAFVQDNITLIKDCLYLTLGSKFEHNYFTGFEVQPNGRLLWTPHKHHSVWASVSRAVRTPSRSEKGGRLNLQVIPPNLPGVNPLPIPVLTTIHGHEDFDSEDLLAYELGYRVQATSSFLLDIAAFYNEYSKLGAFEFGTPFYGISPDTAYLDVPLYGINKMDGETYGTELAADWQALDWWRLRAAYTYIKIQLHSYGNSDKVISESAEGESPQHQFSLRSSMNLPKEIELDVWARYVDELPSLNVESYVTLDVRLGWKLHKNLKLSIAGQNLLDRHHPEFTMDYQSIQPTDVERSVYAKVTWHL